MPTIRSEVLEIVNSQYKVLEIIDLVHFDHQLDKLEELLTVYKDYNFQYNERILILHHDTDYYPSVDSNGFTLYNLVVLLNRFQIPQEHLILFTNHYGIKQEVETLSAQICNTKPMNVIYTSLWYDFHHDPSVKLRALPINNLFCCLNGVNRIHRLITLCYLQEHNILQQGMVSYHFSQ